MQILWKGQTCVHITAARGKQEQVRILIDPFNESEGVKLSPLEADILLLSSGKHETRAVKGNPVVFSTPGEYESKDVFIQGISSGDSRVIYIIEAEGLRVCHLGKMKRAELSSEQVENIGMVHVLFVPVGGGESLDAKEASHVVNQLEPNIVVPMHYAIPRIKEKLEGVEQFLKTLGVKEEEAQQKLVLKQKDIAGEEMKVMVLKP